MWYARGTTEHSHFHSTDLGEQANGIAAATEEKPL